jgi:hypothetical protein
MPVETRPIARLGRYVLSVDSEPSAVVAGGDALQALRAKLADGPSWQLLALVGLGGFALALLARLFAPSAPRPRYAVAYSLDERRLLPPRRWP